MVDERKAMVAVPDFKEGEPVSGINLANLEEAFEGSEDVLVQMLGLFLDQAAERLSQLERYLAAGDDAGARTVLHSLVNISGAVRAYSLSEHAKTMGEAIKRDDRDAVSAVARELFSEGKLVLTQTGALLEAARMNPQDMWTTVLSVQDFSSAKE